MRVAIQRFGLASAAVSLFLLDAKGQSFTEYSLPQPNSFPLAICAGPDGNLWFTELGGRRIGRITTGGVITEFALPVAVEGPRSIAAGPDGNLWYTRAQRIGRITPAGVVTEFSLPAGFSDSIVPGPEGALWLTGSGGIWRVTVTGTFSRFPTFPSPHGITVGSDENLWFTRPGGIGRMTPTGLFSEIPLPEAVFTNEIAAGLDGNVWFTGSSFGRVTPTGTVTLYPLPPLVFPGRITAGPVGSMWFTSDHSLVCPGIVCPPFLQEFDAIGGITLTGFVARFLIPTAGGGPNGITLGPDGNVWFTEKDASKIGRFVPPPGFLAPQDVPVLDIRGTVLFVILLGLAGLFLLRRVS